MSDLAGQEQQPAPPPSPAQQRRVLLGLLLVVLGIAGLLWGVLQISSAGFGTQPMTSIEERRGYDQIKTKVHEVFPYALMRSLAGLALLLVGLRLLQAPESPSPAATDEQAPDGRG